MPTLTAQSLLAGVITYIDADVSNTVVTGNPWTIRTGYANGSTAYQAYTTEGTLTTTISLPSSGVYEVYAYFWGVTDQNPPGVWDGIVDLNGGESIDFVTGDISTIYASSQEFDSAVLFYEGNRGLWAVPLGTVSGSASTTFIVNVNPSLSSSQRTWYDGVGYEEVAGPCYNTPPSVQGAEAMLAIVNRPTLIEVTVDDDGKPYLEGCDPDYPDTGTSYPMEYQWSQLSGSAAVEFDPGSADVKDITVSFPLQGTYELLLEVSDGPDDASQEGGKTTEYIIQVEVIKPIDGDIDLNGSVNLADLKILADQWLTDPACILTLYCADIDNSGKVALEDFSKLSSNWMFAPSTIIINEFLASNKAGLIDGDGSTSDWIELYNQSTDTASLNGWYLTDDADNLKKWPFPADAVLLGESYLVVFASNQPTDNYIDSSGYIHTNFSLDKDGEYLALVSPSGQPVSEYSLEYPPQESDFSYGFWYNMFRYFSPPTPGQSNSDQFLGFTGKPSHEPDRGFYDEHFELSIASDTSEAFIRYTLDGSEPTEQHGTIYDPNDPIMISTTTVVRSVAIKAGYRPGDVKTSTYIFVDDVAQQPADPPGWPDNWSYESNVGTTVPSDYEMDPRVVDNTLPGYGIRDALVDIPTVSIAMLPEDFITDTETNGIYSNSLNRWERKCSVEYILPDGSKGFQEDCKIEVHGNSSRNPGRMQKHSLRLTFTSEYGASKLKYPLFPESDVEEFNQLVLRACFTDSWGLVSWSGYDRYRPNDSQYIRDIWMKESLRDMGQPSSHGNYTHLYVNGLYFGIHNLTERLADDFFADHLGGEPEDWEINADFRSEGTRWNTMKAIDPSTPAGYADIQQYLDVENFADYMLLHFYGDAEDWPSHNGYAAANVVSGDGKFRFFVWDQEIVLDYHGRAAARINSTGSPGNIFQKLRNNEDFRMLFADRVYEHCFNDGALSLTASQNRYLNIANWIDKAIVAESARWGDTQMSTPYGGTIIQPSPMDDINHVAYPPAPNGPDYFFTRADSWLVERDNVINNYIPAIHDTNNSYAIVNVLRNENLYPSIDAPVFNINGSVMHGGYINSDDDLSLESVGAGVTVALVDKGSVWKYLDNGSNQGTAWREKDFADGSWTSGTAELGYNNSPVTTVSYGSNANNKHATTYFRHHFNIEDPSIYTNLVLNIKRDDGAIVYLNGHELGRSNIDDGNIFFNTYTVNSVGGDAEKTFYPISLNDSQVSHLVSGDNVIAVEVHQSVPNSSDLGFDLELKAGTEMPSNSWYTTDGADPRLFGGNLNTDAVQYVDPVSLAQSSRVKTRALNNG
ncbi:MAG: CotH kinase family protein, partial [Anaerohalosphaera sp.]|nr:CotH kinase family protein [Anaerohalosphaera sp.]